MPDIISKKLIGCIRARASCQKITHIVRRRKSMLVSVNFHQEIRESKWFRK